MFTTNSWPLSHAWLHCSPPPYHFPDIGLLSSLCFTLVPHCLLSFYPSHLIYVHSPLTFSPCLAFPAFLKIFSVSISVPTAVAFVSCFHLCCSTTALILSLYSPSSLSVYVCSVSLSLSHSFCFFFSSYPTTPFTKSPACKKWLSSIKVG